ncbi:MAG: RtcB family protein, partial [Bdellovibrionales bacterium]|nr:RtcB family protein [Bdellovibrionales bacterium]
QMSNACELPVSVAGALMPDAHVGYGLPIGGVLATRGAVVPYAVGVDIACRVRVSIVDYPADSFASKIPSMKDAIESETRFGMGAQFKLRRNHGVMDLNWGVTSITKKIKEGAWNQLGTSGSGNHFVEFGEIDLLENFQALPKGRYTAFVSHSGSRGAGAQVARYYSELARAQHPKLPKRLQHLAWLDLDGDGQEYWEAMELMGAYAQANHELIHEQVLDRLGFEVLCVVENHHNFAWKEQWAGQQVIVHRKGATPAGKGVLGYIPGTMIDPGFLVEGLGNSAALNSSAHGAGRLMSRTQARKTTSRHRLEQIVQERSVELLSAGLDESPHAYKDIERVIRAQHDLVRIIGKFFPRVVKMAPEGERAED